MIIYFVINRLIYVLFRSARHYFKSDPEAIEVLEAKHLVLYVYSIFIHMTLKKSKNRNFRNFQGIWFTSNSTFDQKIIWTLSIRTCPSDNKEIVSLFYR